MDWIYKGETVSNIDDIPDNSMYFIYKITNLENDKYYIGSKKIFSITNPETSYKRYMELYREDKSLVRRTKDKKRSTDDEIVWKYKRRDVKRESDWKEYTGSCDELNKDIENGAEYEKEILQYVETSKEKTYAEMAQQVFEGVLYDCDSYNDNILGKFYSFVECQ